MNLEITRNYKIAWVNFFKEIWSFKKEFFVIVISSALTAIMTLLAPYYTQKILKEIESEQAIISVVLILLAIILVNGINFFITAYYSKNLSIRAEVELRNKMMVKMHSFPEEYFYNLQTGGFFSRIISDLKDIKAFSFKFIGNFVSIVFLTIGSFIYLFVFDYRIALIILAIFLIPIFIYIVFFKSLAYTRQLAKITNTQIQISFGERLENLREIKASNQIEHSIKNFEAMQNNYKKMWFGLNLKLSLVEILGFGFSLIMANIITIVSYYFFNHPSFEWDHLSFLIAIVNLAIIPTKNIPAFVNSVILANAAVVRYNDFFEWETEKRANGKHDFKGAISIKNLNFSYKINNKEHVVFSNFNLDIKTGEHIILSKNEFSGKSTLLKLLMNFYSVADNSIFFDKEDINKIDLLEIRKNISYLPSEPKLFSKVFVENKHEKNTDLHSILDELDIREIYYEKYLSHDDDNSVGRFLSSSEKTLISFAHLCLQNKQIILLDNPYAFLNKIQKANMNKLIKNRFKNKTVLICD